MDTCLDSEGNITNTIILSLPLIKLVGPEAAIMFTVMAIREQYWRTEQGDDIVNELGCYPTSKELRVDFRLSGIKQLKLFKILCEKGLVTELPKYNKNGDERLPMCYKINFDKYFKLVRMNYERE